MDADTRPIGYWLKHLHNLIEAQFDAMMSDLGLGRRHWQTLNLLSGTAHTRTQIELALAPFWPDRVPDLDALLDGPDGLTTRGWVGEVPDNALALTEQGRIAYATIAARVGQTRGQLLQGLTPEQYVETVRILAVMAANIEADREGLAPVSDLR